MKMPANEIADGDRLQRVREWMKRREIEIEQVPLHCHAKDEQNHACGEES